MTSNLMFKTPVLETTEGPILHSAEAQNTSVRRKVLVYSRIVEVHLCRCVPGKVALPRPLHSSCTADTPISCAQTLKQFMGVFGRRCDNQWKCLLSVPSTRMEQLTSTVRQLICNDSDDFDILAASLARTKPCNALAPARFKR